jgi:uncharacterized protein YjbI with pentapeptide repeats
VSESEKKNYNKKHYDLLKKCSDKKDLTEWNKFALKLLASNKKILLQNAVLVGAYLRTAILVGANLENANLENAILWDAILENAILTGANLKDADLINANLKDADLINANLENAILLHTNLKNADLWNTNLNSTALWNAHLENAKFFGVSINKNTDFRTYSFEKAFYYSGLKESLEYCNRRLNWHDCYKKQNKIIEFIVQCFWEFSNYGRSTGRIIGSFLGFSIYFAIIYWLNPDLINNLEKHEFIKSLYFSIITMTTLGFGDMSANPQSEISQIIVMFHVIIGYVILGALITRLSILFNSDGPAFPLEEEIARTKITKSLIDIFIPVFKMAIISCFINYVFWNYCI